MSLPFGLERRRCVWLLLGLAALAGVPQLAAQTAWPSKPVRILVPFPPGGTTDILARAIAPELSKALGQSVVVDNRPGAGGNLGADLVAKSAPDGYTLLMGTVGTHGINKSLYARLPYDPQKDFAPITLVAGVPNVMVMNAERAKALGIAKPVYILGGGECYTHEHIFLMPSLTTTGAVQSSAKAYAMAGCGPKDIDVAGIYDCFTGTVIMMLEDLGFCPKGEGGRFVEDGQITYGGAIPCNTHGGLLSFAHSGMPGSLFHFYEVVNQLRGSCGERQVAGAELGLVHSLGAGFATNATTILGTEATL